MDVNVFVINIQPHNWERCKEGHKFGIRKGAVHHKFSEGDIFLARITGKEYGVKAIWAFVKEQKVEDQSTVPWTDAEYSWLLHFSPLIHEFKTPFTERFVGVSKFSDKIGINSMRLAGSSVQLKPKEIKSYLRGILEEKAHECSIVAKYRGHERKVSELLQETLDAAEKGAASEIKQIETTRRSPKDIVGPPINFRGLVYAPLNEAGVVLLFSKMMSDLGIIYESSPPEYPDMVGRIQTDKGFELKYFEFEYKSSNFKLHKHDPSKCDYLVCWEHD